MRKKIKFKNTSNIKTKDYKWVITIIIVSFVLSVVINSLSSGIMPMVKLPIAFVLLAILVLIGILFDILGVAVAGANETPFHSMASSKVKGAKEALWLIRNAEKVSNICNDVVGDTIGIISGTAISVIVVKIAGSNNPREYFISIIMAGIVASLTIGGKAFGKGFAIAKSNSIVYFAATIMCFITNKNRQQKGR